MQKQNYNNHIRYYIPHHFIFYPAMLSMMIFSVVAASENPDQQSIWYFLTCLTLSTTLLSFMTRQHYALTSQNRIIKLEVKFRYYVLTQKNFEEIASKLSDGQIYALRFASDEEFVSLVEKTISEGLNSNEIKKSIVQWKADNERM